MARVTGKAGKITIGAVEIAQMFNWKVDGVLDVVDATAFQDTWRQKLSTFKSWKASAEGRWTGDAAFWTAFDGTTAVSLEFFLVAGGTTKWAGTGFCNFSITVPHDGVVNFTVSIEGTGSLTLTP